MIEQLLCGSGSSGTRKCGFGSALWACLSFAVRTSLLFLIAQALIGNSSSYLPTLYILTKSDFSVQHAAETIAEHLRQEHKEKTVYLHYDLAFEWKMGMLRFT